MSLFANSPAQAEPDKQVSLGLSGSVQLSQALSEKYKPKTLDGFIGLEKQKKVLSAFAARPMPCAWFFLGNSGTGKSAMAFALANQLDAEIHHIPSQKANIESLNDVARLCSRYPYRFYGENPGPAKWHFVIIEEADHMSSAFQLALLSRLDGTAPLAQTIFIFTANGTEGLEPRFLSRVRVMEFSSYGMRSELAALLAKVWESETGSPGSLNWERIAKESNTNVRDALQTLEIELLAA